MNKVKALTVAVIFLFLLNLGLIFFILSSKRPMEGGPRNVIIKTLEFDDQQQAEFIKLIQSHQENIKSQDKNIVALKQELYQGLIDDEVDIDTLFTLLAKEQAVIEKMHYQHFQDLKKLCKADQKDNFEELTMRLAELFSNKNRPNRPNRPPQKGLTFEGNDKIE